MNNSLYLLMKEQISMSVYNYQEKMKQALKAQAQEIQKLSSIIAYNNKYIQSLQEIIIKMGQKEEKLDSTTRSKYYERD